MEKSQDTHDVQRQIVLDAYARGLRSYNLEEQPAPWLLRGLQLLEEGKELTTDEIKKFNLAGGTDHPDPWFG